MGCIAKQGVKADKPSEPLVVMGADRKKAHVRAEVSVRCDNKEVDLLHLGLRPLFEEAVVDNMGVGVQHKEVENGDGLIEGEHGHGLFLNGIPHSRTLGGARG